jgi:hypothetical protein
MILTLKHRGAGAAATGSDPRAPRRGLAQVLSHPAYRPPGLPLRWPPRLICTWDPREDGGRGLACRWMLVGGAEASGDPPSAEPEQRRASTRRGQRRVAA